MVGDVVGMKRWRRACRRQRWQQRLRRASPASAVGSALHPRSIGARDRAYSSLAACAPALGARQPRPSRSSTNLVRQHGSFRPRPYTWEPNDRLKMIVDALNGPVQVPPRRPRQPRRRRLRRRQDRTAHARRRRQPLQGTEQEGPQVRPRRTASRIARADGITKYEYDPEGNLTARILPDGSAWTYEWNGAGMLAKVVRPDARSSSSATTPSGAGSGRSTAARTTKWILGRQRAGARMGRGSTPAVEVRTSQQEAVAWDVGLSIASTY